jgi:hypothetical protein
VLVTPPPDGSTTSSGSEANARTLAACGPEQRLIEVTEAANSTVETTPVATRGTWSPLTAELVVHAPSLTDEVSLFKVTVCIIDWKCMCFMTSDDVHTQLETEREAGHAKAVAVGSGLPEALQPRSIASVHHSEVRVIVNASSFNLRQ